MIGFFALIGLLSSGFGGFLAMVGFGGFVVAIVALAKGSLRSLFIRSRPLAGAVLAGSLVVLFAAAATSPPPSPTPLNVAQTGTDVAEVPEVGPSATPTRAPAADITTRREQTTSVVPFESTTVDDPTRDVGSTAITVAGVNGVRTTIWMITFSDGDEIDRSKVSEEVTVPPVNQVTSVGSKVPPPAAPVQPSCDSNYAGACVPIASDVDCAGGSGNGPAYVSGPVSVIGSDIYDLDRDGDGIGCD